jgi:tryptophanyl-tRNA synthetase
LPTFKEKVRQQPDNVNYGLLGYPVLMAADITLYKADTVPVGDDQLPHLEFTREIVRRFNYQFGGGLIEPEAKLSETPRIMGLDGLNKMSKSLDNHIELAAIQLDSTRLIQAIPRSATYLHCTRSYPRTQKQLSRLRATVAMPASVAWRTRSSSQRI